MYYFKLNIQNIDEGLGNWPGSRICKKMNLKSFFKLRTLKVKNLEYPFWRIDKEKSLQLIKKGGWQDMNRPKNPYDKKGKPDWEIKADREELADIDRKLNIVKNVGKGVVGAVGGSYAYGKWKRHTRSKKKKDKK